MAARLRGATGGGRRPRRCGRDGRNAIRVSCGLTLHAWPIFLTNRRTRARGDLGWARRMRLPIELRMSPSAISARRWVAGKVRNEANQDARDRVGGARGVAAACPPPTAQTTAAKHERSRVRIDFVAGWRHSLDATSGRSPLRFSLLRYLPNTSTLVWTTLSLVLFAAAHRLDADGDGRLRRAPTQPAEVQFSDSYLTAAILSPSWARR